MISPDRRRKKNEALAGILILLVLAAILGGVILMQFRFNPAVSAGSAAAKLAVANSHSVPDSSMDLSAFISSRLTPLSPQEIFDVKTLSNKIDGRAELYLTAGFKRLLCRRFALNNDPQAMMEVFVYDMGNYRQAFAVYSSQRRSDAETVTLPGFAYRAANAIFFIHSRYYIEIIAVTAAPVLRQEMLFWGEKFLSGVSLPQEEIGELELFPRQGLDRNSLILLSADVFGCNRLNNVFTADFEVGRERITAFLSRRESPDEAAQLASAYEKFLLENGGERAVPSPGALRAALIKIMDTYEVIFSYKNFLAGVHAAPDEKSARSLALKLNRRLGEVVP